jgi:hypothetical protein
MSPVIDSRLPILLGAPPAEAVELLQVMPRALPASREEAIHRRARHMHCRATNQSMQQGHNPISMQQDHNPISMQQDYNPMGHNPISMRQDHNPISTQQDHNPISMRQSNGPLKSTKTRTRDTSTPHAALAMSVAARALLTPATAVCHTHPQPYTQPSPYDPLNLSDPSDNT